MLDEFCEGLTGGERWSEGAKRPHNLVVVGSRPTRPTPLGEQHAARGRICVLVTTYHGYMSDLVPLEDKRGIDVAHIRELLALSPAQRVEHMLQVVTRLRAIATQAREARA